MILKDSMRSFSESDTNKQVPLPDGRKLGFAEYGDPLGQPVMFFPGLPGSRLFRHPDDALTAHLGIRLIVVDRPGIGLSDPAPGRTLLSWPNDVLVLARALGLDRFVVMGFGAGAAYALACAYQIPRRVSRVVIVSGMTRLNVLSVFEPMVPMFRNFAVMAVRAPLLLRLVMYFGAREAQNHPEDYWNRMNMTPLCPADMAWRFRPEIQRVYVESIRETFAHGSTAFSDDTMLVARDWGFRLEAISVPVQLWHGLEDRFTPVQMGRYIAERVPVSEAHFIPNAGHALLFSHWQPILTQVQAAD